MIWGQFAYLSGVSGTASVPLGATVVFIHAESHDPAGAVTIFGGSSIPLDGGAAAGAHMTIDQKMDPGWCVAKTAARDIVFTSTIGFYVAYLLAPGQG
jgi:hypothetical protein